MRNHKILAASLICADPLNLERDIGEIILGEIDWIHFDVMDGSFVPRYGLYPEILQRLRQQTNLPVDVHMMVSNQINMLRSLLGLEQIITVSI